jgi:hypothetical protein
MMVLPVAPFTFKVHSGVATLFIVLFVLSTAANLVAFPFTQLEPLKVSFQQTVALGNLSSYSFPYPQTQISHATTTLVGLNGYVRNLLLPKLPSAIGQDVVCSELRKGIESCSWNSTLLPSPSGMDLNYPPQVNNWLLASVSRLGPNSARFFVQGMNTRGCRIYFDNKPIKHFEVYGSEPGMLPQFSGPPEGFVSLRLWSRTWTRNGGFSVDVEWEGDSALEGRIACEWAEYESGTAGMDRTRRGKWPFPFPETIPTGKIPALEEILAFLPRYAAVSKLNDGLVEAWGSFSI